VVLPDGSGIKRDQAKTPRGVAVVGIVTLVGLVAFGLGRLTTPSVDASETTTITAPSLQPPVTVIDEATWTVEQIATDRQFTWQQVETFDTWPLGLLEVDGTLFLFGSPTPPFEDGERYGLDLWTSTNGLGWESKGTVVPPEVAIHDVAASDGRFVAAGSLLDGSPILLTSNDGSSWTELRGPPLDTSPFAAEFEITYLSADLLILSELGDITVEGSFDDRTIEDALPEKWRGDDVDWYVDGSKDDPTIIVSGPFGITLAEIAPEELGLSDQDLTPSTNEFLARFGTKMWTLGDGVWSDDTLQGTDPPTIHALPDGRLIAVGFTRYGPVPWISTEGRSWNREPTFRTLMNETSRHWGNGMITRFPNSSAPDLVYTSDFENWRSLGVSDLLPDEFSWSFEKLAAGGAGIALVAETDIESTPEGASQAAAIESGEFVLTLDASTESLLLLREDEQIVAIPVFDLATQENVALDLERRTLTILDPADKQPLVSFEFEELRDLEDAAYDDFYGNVERALLFSTDGADWIIQPLDPVDVSDILVLEDRIVISVLDPSTFRPGTDQQSTTIWVGTLP